MAPRKQSTKPKSTPRGSASTSDCAEATRCIQQILRIAGASRHSENSTRNGKYKNAKKVSKSTSPSRIAFGCRFSDRNLLHNTLLNSLTSTHRHNRQPERTQRRASIRPQHDRQEVILNAIAARFMVQRAERLSSRPRTKMIPMFELLVREMAGNGGDMMDLGALMDAMQIDTSAAELEEMFRGMDIDEEL
ncbi:hypothetical protein RUND412_006942 [Rhizina undulata]